METITTHMSSVFRSMPITELLFRKLLHRSLHHTFLINIRYLQSDSTAELLWLGFDRLSIQRRNTPLQFFQDCNADGLPRRHHCIQLEDNSFVNTN